MAKFILTMIMCSYASGQCIPPIEFPKHFDDMYDCMTAGYQEALKKTEELGKDQINEYGIYIKFGCSEKQVV